MTTPGAAAGTGRLRPQPSRTSEIRPDPRVTSKAGCVTHGQRDVRMRGWWLSPARRCVAIPLEVGECTEPVRQVTRRAPAATRLLGDGPGFRLRRAQVARRAELPQMEIRRRAPHRRDVRRSRQWRAPGEPVHGDDAGVRGHQRPRDARDDRRVAFAATCAIRLCQVAGNEPHAAVRRRRVEREHIPQVGNSRSQSSRDRGTRRARSRSRGRQTSGRPITMGAAARGVARPQGQVSRIPTRAQVKAGRSAARSLHAQFGPRNVQATPVAPA